MKTIVIYKSNTGFTKKYAEWIAAELLCEAIPAEQAKNIDLALFDTVIFGGWFFAGNIIGLKEYKEKIMAFQGKKAIFAVGAMPPAMPEAAKILHDLLTEEERKSIGTFYMQGGLDYKHMSVIHKMMMKMMCNFMKKEKGINSPEYKTISQSFDATVQSAIMPLIEYIRK